MIVEAFDARTARAHTLGQRALRHQLELDFTGEVFLAEDLRILRFGKRADYFRDAILLHKDCHAGFAAASVVSDEREALGALPDQRLQQPVGNARAAEPADHDRCAVVHVRDGFLDCRYDLVQHAYCSFLFAAAHPKNSLDAEFIAVDCSSRATGTDLKSEFTPRTQENSSFPLRGGAQIARMGGLRRSLNPSPP